MPSSPWRAPQAVEGRLRAPIAGGAPSGASESDAAVGLDARVPTGPHAELERRLRDVVKGEVRFDALARALYSTDASPYRIAPIGVVVPLDEDDVKAAVRVAYDLKVPILPRGGGTSLAGQTVAAALVIDMSKHLTALLELNVEQRWVRVQPGLVRDQLNAKLAGHALQFTPDVATTDRANVGGMVANNSAGTRSIKYGKSVDQVVEARVLLVDGTELELKPLTGADLTAKLAEAGREGELYRAVHTLVTEHAAKIAERYPKVMRRVGGYNLDELTNAGSHGQRPFNLAKLVSGSEGTLALILELKLALHPVPKRRIVTMLHFASLTAAFEAVKFVNRHGPSAVEIIDRALIVLGRENPAMAPLMGWVVGDPEAVLLVEFDGEDLGACRRALAGLEADQDVAALSYGAYLAEDPKQQKEISDFRRDGLGIYATMPGAAKPTPFIEDAAIPVEHLAQYIPEVIAVCERHGTRAVFYAHASVGVIHVRPLLDLKDAAGIAKFRAISEEVFDLVVKYGGSWSGEHGDGLIRSYQNRRLFGDELYEAFIAVKRAFDPDWLMNPGKIVEAPAMTENLRYGADYPTLELPTVFDFSEQDGFLGAVEACTGVGACRKVGAGTMCPSYMGTRDEDNSTRGRANVLREALTGGLPGGPTSDDVYRVLDLCLECKACKSECPSRVDMAKLKYEWLQHYYDVKGTPLSARAMGNVGRLAPLAQALAPVANFFLPLKPVRWLLEKTVGVDERRTLPRYSAQRFDTWFRRRAKPAAGALGRVALFADTWTMFNQPEVGQAAVAVLERIGYDVELVAYGCCGRPQISKGLAREAQRMARGNVAALHAYVERGVPVVGLEPSCVAAFTDDYPDLVPGEETRAVAGNVRMLEEFLAKEWAKGRFDPKAVFRKDAGSVQFHGHCQQKAVLPASASSTRALLEWISDDVRVLDAGCCGMAGSFGYSHHDLSMTIGEQRLFPAVREFEGTTAAPGFSCRHQVSDGTGKTASHPIELLASYLR